MGKPQFLVVLLGVVLVFVLFKFGNTIPPKKQETPVAMSMPSGLTFDQYESIQLKTAQDSIKTNIGIEKNKLTQSGVTTEQKGAIYRRIADLWQKQGNIPLTAYYSYKLAQEKNTKEGYINAANNFFIAFTEQNDTLIQQNVINFALSSYEEAQKRGDTGDDLKIKIARLYVQGTGEPMKGIGILREIIQKDSTNVPALVELGRLSIMSGQFENAVQRLEAAIRLEPQNAEALYFLALSNEGLGKKDLAIKQLEMCKLLVANEDFNREIDEYILTLKNK